MTPEPTIEEQRDIEAAKAALFAVVHFTHRRLFAELQQAARQGAAILEPH